jgi:hypothetical protein
MTRRSFTPCPECDTGQQLDPCPGNGDRSGKTEKGSREMRVLLSTYGSRGDVEPIAALAVRLQALGAEVRMCAPPDEEFADCRAAPPVRG